MSNASELRSDRVSEQRRDVALSLLLDIRSYDVSPAVCDGGSISIFTRFKNRCVAIHGF